MKRSGMDPPAGELELVVNEAGTGHRLDGCADRLTVFTEPACEDAKPIGIRWHGADVHRLAAVVQNVDVQAFPAEIQANVQHMTGPPVVLDSECHCGGPLHGIRFSGKTVGKTTLEHVSWSPLESHQHPWNLLDQRIPPLLHRSLTFSASSLP
jgi:hypothetical protein